MHISSSYAKILGEKLFRTWEVPRSGSKAEDGERKKERLNDGENNGQATHGARKPPGPKINFRAVPDVIQKANGSEKEKTEEKKEERKLVITMAKRRMAHASRLGQLLLTT